MKPRKKISLVTPIFPPDVGGPASYVFEVGQRLKKEYSVNILGFCEGKHARMKKVDIRTLNPHKRGFFRRQWWLRRQLKKTAKDSDSIYIQGPIVVGVNALQFALKHRIPTMMKFVGDIAWEDASRRGKTTLNLQDWLAGPATDWKSSLIRRLQKWSFHNVDKLVVPSQFLKDILMEFYEVPEEKIEMIFNAFDGQQSRHGNVKERAYKLMTAGRLVPHKNVDKVIEALSKLPEEYTLDVFGNGPERRRLEAMASNLNVDKRVKFLGNVPQRELHKAMTTHDLFVLYSSYEGLPHVVLEAFSNRCPVIASDIRGTNEVAIDQKTAILAAPENAMRLAEAIRNLSWDRKQREFLSNQAVRFLKSDFSWDSHIGKLNKVL